MTDIPTRGSVLAPPATPLPTDLNQPPSVVPGVSPEELRGLQELWPELSPKARAWMWRLAESAIAADTRAPSTSEHERRAAQLAKNRQAIDFFQRLAADESIDPDQVETLAILEEALPDQFE